MPIHRYLNSGPCTSDGDPTDRLPEPAHDQVHQLDQDIILRAGKISSEFKIDKEMIMQSLNIQVTIYVHQLKRHKPTAWSEALVGMAQDAPPEVKKGGGRKQVNGADVK